MRVERTHTAHRRGGRLDERPRGYPPATAAPATSATTTASVAKAAPNAWAKLSLAQKTARLDQARKLKVLVAVTTTLGARKRHTAAVRGMSTNLAVAAEKAAAEKVTQADAGSVAAAQAEATRLAAARTHWAEMLPAAEARPAWRATRNREIARRALAQANARVKAADAHEAWVVQTRATGSQPHGQEPGGSVLLRRRR